MPFNRTDPLLADPLLALGKGIILVAQGLIAVAALALIIAIPGVVLFEETITAYLRTEFADPTFVVPVLAVIGLALGGLAVAILIFLFLQNLRRIIATVGQGDPFMPINARRLTAMAWLMLAVELVTIPMGALALYLLSIFEPDEGVAGATPGFDFSGLILVVTLFILARVFRKGAEMRSDLEGTV